MPKSPSPRKKGNRWEINYTDAFGKRQFRTFRTKREATSALHHLNAEAESIRAGALAQPPEPHSFSELADYWLKHRAPRKRSGADDRSIINRHLRPYFGEIELPVIGVELIDQFTLEKAEDLSPKTLRNILTLFGTMLRLAQRLGWLASLPHIDKPRIDEQDYQWIRTKEQLRKLLVTAREEPSGTMEFYATALYTGMRAGEICGLRWEDVDLDRRLITVKRSYDNDFTKTGRIRHVPILTPLLRVLRTWKVASASPWIFPNTVANVRKPSDRILQETWKRTLDRAEVPRVRFHDARHTFASHWVMAGGDIFRLQKILGHKDIKMTLRYAHLAPDAFVEDYDRLDDLVPADEQGEVISLDTAPAHG